MVDMQSESGSQAVERAAKAVRQGVLHPRTAEAYGTTRTDGVKPRLEAAPGARVHGVRPPAGMGSAGGDATGGTFDTKE